MYLPKFCKKYFQLMDDNPHHFCKDQYLLRALVTAAFESGEIYADEKQADAYFKLSRLIGYENVYPWEKFFLGLHLCTYWKSDDRPVWGEALCMMGRGNGKDGCISLEIVDLSSPFNKIQHYDVDIAALTKEQAFRPITSVTEAFDSKKSELKKMYRWSRERIYGRINHTPVMGHAHNAKTKDGLRTGCLILNEIHTYENFNFIDVMKSGMGKKPHPRTTYYTTNGYVSDGPLDSLLSKSAKVLGACDWRAGFLPFLCRLDDKDEVEFPDLWHKANPSLIYKPELMDRIKDEYEDWKAEPERFPAFLTKRMNIRQQAEATAVTSWDNIEATSDELPDLTGWECVVGVDFSKITDFAAVNLHFRKGDQRYDICKAWLCDQSADLPRLKCPLKEWEAAGHLRIVHGPEIPPHLITDYILAAMKKYKVIGLAMDSYRFWLMADLLKPLGFDAKDKTLKLVRPSDIMKVSPTIDRTFACHNFTWGDNPLLRWATNNTALIPTKQSKLSATGENDTGNFLYGKIEPRSRKTDPFMALVHSMTIEDMLPMEPSMTDTKKKRRALFW